MKKEYLLIVLILVYFLYIQEPEKVYITEECSAGDIFVEIKGEVLNQGVYEIEDGTRTRWKWANVLLPSLIIVGLGFYRSKNEKTKADILKQIYE